MFRGQIRKQIIFFRTWFQWVIELIITTRGWDEVIDDRSTILDCVEETGMYAFWLADKGASCIIKNVDVEN